MQPVKELVFNHCENPMTKLSLPRVGRIGAMLFVLTAFCLVLAGTVPFNGSSAGSVTFTSPTTATVESLGHATILGPFRSHENLVLGAGGSITGTITWMTADGSTMLADVNGGFTSGNTAAGTYTITGGTGRMEGASGTGNFTATLDQNFNVSVTFTGELESH